MDEEGVSVGEVLPGSPAEKAGLKRGDRILSSDDFAVAELSDLVDAVQTEETITMKIRRGDETIEVEVTPAERPRDLDGRRAPWGNIHLDERWEGLMPHLRGMVDGDLEDFDISMIHPGVVIGPAELPKGVSITVQRDGDGPAKIAIKRGNDSWEVTEDSIDELPDDLQGPAKKVLSAVGGRTLLRRPGVERQFERILPGLRAAPEKRIRRRPRNDSENKELRSQLEDMRNEIQELREMLKELKRE
ncbi:PDZ domain-containing protein [Planctomycetota bacterium]